MKKLVFAAIAAMVMVSASNVFASNKINSVSTTAPVDTVAPADTTNSEQPTVQATDTAASDTAIVTE